MKAKRLRVDAHHRQPHLVPFFPERWSLWTASVWWSFLSSPEPAAGNGLTMAIPTLLST